MIRYVVPALVMLPPVCMACRAVRRWLRLRGAWNSGLTAEGRCLGVYPAGRGGLHHVYEFIARDGRVIRFEEDGGPAATVEGDYVMVRYTSGRRVVATALVPSRARRAMTAVGVLAFLAVVVVFCASLVTVYAQATGPYADLVSGVDQGTSVPP
ncbi:hypothetical protein [Streptomyces sp.]|uniref:hypothetical protein n=1 Tax=Streptomyces sp. TaxID=1931 RepID=UPI002811B633|nr:hypothetical protein [Streptomyces sp.]